MPPMMVVPTERRPAAPAPEAMARGMNAEDEGERGHEDGAQAKLGGFDGGVDDGAALGAQLLGELDDEDGVFGGETDEHDEADLAVDVVGEAAQGYGEQRAEDGHGHGEQDDEGQREALVECGEGEIDDEDAEAEDDDGFAGGLDFFERRGRSTHRSCHASCFCCATSSMACEAFTGAEAGRGGAIDFGGAEEVVVADDLGT